jgi:acetyltransferase-like isoleucine patch superfamily enzyme
MTRRSAFAKPLVYAPPGAHEPFRLLAIRALQAVLSALQASAFRDRGWLNRLKERLAIGELYRTDLLAYRVACARRMGMKVGEGCRLYSLQIASEAELIELGDNVIVSGEVVFVTHDGALYTALEEFPDINGHYGRIRVGSRSFIGMRAVIMPGVELGENCVVAAGAVVMDSFPANSVIAGNPAAYVCPRSMYLEMKKQHPGTVTNAAYPFPLKYPPHLLAAQLANMPFKQPRRRSAAPAGAPSAALRPLLHEEAGATR